MSNFVEQAMDKLVNNEGVSEPVLVEAAAPVEVAPEIADSVAAPEVAEAPAPAAEVVAEAAPEAAPAAQPEALNGDTVADPVAPTE